MQIVEQVINDDVVVLKNDTFELNDLDCFDYIILSPGPGLPAESGRLLSLIERYADSKKIFGVCLGLQAIAIHYGAKLYNLPTVYHGHKDQMMLTDKESPIFHDIPSEFFAGRYHSWVIDSSSDISKLSITAVDGEGIIMAAEHQVDKVYGVQFHPESYMTEWGYKIIENFLALP